GEQRNGCACNEKYRSEVTQCRTCLASVDEPSPQRRPSADGAFEFAPPLVDQPVAYVRRSFVRAVTFGGVAGKLNRLAGYFFLAKAGAAGQFFDNVPIAVARGEGHVGVHFGRVESQRVFDDALGFNKLPPIGCAERAQAGDTVADRNLVGRL